MSDAERILICPRVSEAPAIEPAGQWACSECAEKVWYAPKSAEILRKYKTDVKVYCNECGWKLIREAVAKEPDKVHFAVPTKTGWKTSDGKPV